MQGGPKHCTTDVAADLWRECQQALQRGDIAGFTFNYYALALAEQWACYEWVNGKWIDRGVRGCLRWAGEHATRPQLALQRLLESMCRTRNH